jgi:hypothetical protein
VQTVSSGACWAGDNAVDKLTASSKCILAAKIGCCPPFSKSSSSAQSFHVRLIGDQIVLSMTVIWIGIGEARDAALNDATYTPPGRAADRASVRQTVQRMFMQRAVTFVAKPPDRSKLNATPAAGSSPAPFRRTATAASGPLVGWGHSPAAERNPVQQE